eukprot:10287658-Alexandrium_andersonii.AAC.1
MGGLADWRIGVSYFAVSRLRTPSITHFAGGFGSCARHGAERTSRELPGPISRPFLGPRSSSSKRLERLCDFRMADCGLRRIVALMGLARIADCTLDLLR